MNPQPMTLTERKRALLGDAFKPTCLDTGFPSNSVLSNTLEDYVED